MSVAKKPSAPRAQRTVNTNTESKPTLVDPNNHFLFTVDVEDWFQVENFKSLIPFDSWNTKDLRVERNTHRILDLLDSAGSVASPKATFFILGWIARKLPHLVREIHFRGHEVASHGVNHHLCTDQSKNALVSDLTESKSLLEDIIGSPIQGYRAPSFSINNDILKIIEDAGYRYDASYNSFDKHGRYGKISTGGLKKKGIAFQISDGFFTIPVSNLNISFNRRKSNSNQAPEYANSVMPDLIRHPAAALNHDFRHNDNSKVPQPHRQSKNNPIMTPLGGGGYFRLIPYIIFRQGIKSILNQEGAYSFYLHPWELDPSQPRVTDAPQLMKFRHYVNLSSTKNKIQRMLADFKSCHFITCNNYLDKLTKAK